MRKSNPGQLVLILWMLAPWVSTNAQEQLVFYLPDSTEMYFTFIPAGSFLMGSDTTEKFRNADEGPQQDVVIEEGFYLGTYEVTQRQWLAMMHHNPATFQQLTTHLEHPVESVTWNMCQAFIEELNVLGKGRFRLPTEKEWEYACRAGTTSSYYWGESEEWVVHQYSWTNSRSMATTHPVGEKIPNAWGLYDMIGNVWEWTATPYHKYGEIPDFDVANRVFRGGSYYDFYDSNRCANRHRHEINRPYTAIGLRLVYEPDLSE